MNLQLPKVFAASWWKSRIISSHWQLHLAWNHLTQESQTKLRNHFRPCAQCAEAEMRLRRIGTNGSAPSSLMQIPLNQELSMSGNSDKAAGATNEAIGKAKQGIGNVVGSDKMKSEGATQELKGDAQKTTGDAKNAAKDAIDKTAAALKKPL